MSEAWRGVKRGDGSLGCSGNVLSVVLTRQRPDQDCFVRRAVCDAVRSHGEGLTAWVGGDFAVPGVPGVRFYEPVTAFLWGPYDQAVFFLGDEVESVLNVATGTGAEAQEVIFGPLFEWEPTSANRALTSLFARSDQHPRVIAISCLKLGDHHLSTFGVALRHAVWRRVHQIAEAHGVDCVGLNTWSRAELCVILLGDDAATMADAVAEFEKLQLVHLWDDLEGGLPPDDELARTIPGFNSSAWSIGIRDEKGCQVRPESQPREVVIDSLKWGHVVVTGHTQFGMLGSGADLAEPVPSAIGQVWAQAFSDRKGMPFPSRAVFCAEVAPVLARLSPEGCMLDATLRLLPKAGHAGPIRKEAQALASALRRVDPSVSIEISEGMHGDGLTVDLALRVDSRCEALRGLAALTLWFRARPGLQAHLLDGSTSLTRRRAVGWMEGAPDKFAGMPEPAASRPLRGFDLLRANQGLPHNHHTRSRLNRLGMGQAEQHALTGLIEAVREARSRPDMFGAMLWLDGAVDYIQSTVFDPHCNRGALPEAVHAWIHHLHHAYQQCIQFSAANRGAPPIRAELPYGVNQFVGTIAGAAAASLSIAALMKGRRARMPANEPVILFWPDSSVALRRVRGVGFFRLSAPQAMTPLVLTPLLQHEPGHQMLQVHIGEQHYAAWEEQTRDAARVILPYLHAGLELLRGVGEDLTPTTIASTHLDSLAIERLSLFLEDVFCNAVWRRVGCEGDLDLFRTQVLAAQALGVRTGEWDRKAHEQRSAPEAWAATLAHIRVQEALSENGEDLHRALIAAGAACPDGLLDAALRFAGAELARSLEDGKDVTWELRVRVDALWLGPLGCALVEPQGPYMDCVRRLAGFLAHLQDKVVDHLDDEIVRLRLRATLDDVTERVRHGRPVPTPPWSVVQPPYRGDTLLPNAGHPSPVAFLWVRAILRGVTRAFDDLAAPTGSLSQELGPDNSPLEPPREGLYTDPRGCLLVAGRAQRSRHQRVRATAIEALADLSSRLRAGRLFRLLRLRRSFRRWATPVGGVDAEWREVSVLGKPLGGDWRPCKVMDLSPASLHIQVDADHARGLHAPSHPGECDTHWITVRGASTYRRLAVRRKAEGSLPVVGKVYLGLELTHPDRPVDPNPDMVESEPT